MFLKNLIQNLSKVLVAIVWLAVIIFDIITFLPCFLIQRPWRRWKAIYEPRSAPVASGSGYVVRGSVAPMPEHFASKCRTINQAVSDAVEHHGRDRTCVAYREILEADMTMLVNGKVFPRYRLSDYKWMTLGELYDQIVRFGHALTQIGCGKQDKVIIYADSCVSWLISAQGIIANGSVLVTLYATLSDQGVVQGVQETEAEYIITSKLLIQRLLTFQHELSTITHIILLDVKQDSQEFDKIRAHLKPSIRLSTFESLVESGQIDFYDKNPVDIDEHDVAIIMYTSGSAGVPKGVMITHRNMMEGFRSCLSFVGFLLPQIDRHVYIAYLPLAHILEFGVQTFLIFLGLRLGYSSPHTLVDVSQGLLQGTPGDATLLQPTLMASVPLILDRIRKAVFAKLSEKGPLAVKFFEFLIEYKTFWMSKGFTTPMLDWLFLKKNSNILGGRMEMMLTGGAPLSAETQKIIRACLNVDVFSQGYGSTEMVCGGMFMNENDYTLAKVGGPVRGMLVKLVDWNEGGYLTSDKPNPRGEIHIATESLSIGYYKLPELDKESYYKDGEGVRWFRTGDVGELFPNGSFKIIDRKKDFLKLQFGEYVSLGKIETKLKTSYLVNNVCVVGNSLYKYLIAVIVPNPKIIEKFHKRLQLKTRDIEPSDMYDNIKLKTIFYRKLVSFCRQCGLRKYEIPKDIILVSDEWLPESGLVTASFKLKRKNIEQFYMDRIQETFTNVSYFD